MAGDFYHRDCYRRDSDHHLIESWTSVCDRWNHVQNMSPIKVSTFIQMLEITVEDIIISKDYSLPYTAKLSRGKTFAVGIEKDRSRENVCGSSISQ